MKLNHYILVFCCVVHAAATVADGQSQPGVYEGLSVAAWVEKLQDEDKRIRRRAAYALGQIGPAAAEAVPALMVAADDTQLEVGWYALDALGRIGQAAAEAVPEIIRIVEKSDKYPILRRNAAAALGKIGPAAQAAVPLLQEALTGPDGTYAAASAKALWQIARQQAALSALGAQLASENDDVALAAAMALLDIGADAEPVAKQLTIALGHENADVRRAAARALSQIGKPAISFLTTALRHPDRFDPISVLNAFGWILEDARNQVLHDRGTSLVDFKAEAGSLQKEIVTPLIPSLDNPRADVRAAAARALARSGPMVVPSLLDVLQGTSQPARSATIEALAAMEGFLPRDTRQMAGVEWIKEVSLPKLTAALSNRDRMARRAAFRLFDALRIGAYGKTAIHALRREGLRDEDVLIRRYAAQSLDRIQESE